MATAWIALGSDLGHRPAWLRRGLRLLDDAGATLERASSLYLTEPVGDPALPWFHNAVARMSTELSPEALLRACLEAERRCGRRRGPRREARALDLDLLLYDDVTVAEPGIRIPHPRMHERRFVLRPLAEIDPDRVLPGSGLDVASLLDDLPEAEGVWLLASPAWTGSAIRSHEPIP